MKYGALHAESVVIKMKRLSMVQCFLLLGLLFCSPVSGLEARFVFADDVNSPPKVDVTCVTTSLGHPCGTMVTIEGTWKLSEQDALRFPFPESSYFAIESVSGVHVKEKIIVPMAMFQWAGVPEPDGSLKMETKSRYVVYETFKTLGFPEDAFKYIKPQSVPFEFGVYSSFVVVSEANEQRSLKIGM